MNKESHYQLWYNQQLFINTVFSVFVESMSESPKGAKGEAFLKKAEREKCWNARDDYQNCMKKQGEDDSACAEFRKLFVGNCPPTWVTHFDRKFQYEKFKAEALNKGHDKLDQEYLKK